MLESIRSNEALEYKKLSAEEMASRNILGRLVGNCADFIMSTRNGRKYTEELWEKVFNNPIMKEKLDNKVLYGELGHPADRTEIDMEKVCVCMPEKPKKNSDGKLVAVFDILDTPNGRILDTFCKYGSVLGVSSRGTGDVITDDYGEEVVDPDTYECECWDIVILPAVQSARVQYVNESFDANRAKLRKALKESFDNASEDDKRIMSSTLHSLDIDLEESEGEKETEDVADTTKGDAGDAGDELVRNLQESLIENKRLQATIVSLQEKLSVGYAKEVEYEKENNKLKLAVSKLTEAVKNKDAVKSQVKTLKTQLEDKINESDRKSRIAESYKSRLGEATSTNARIIKESSNKDAEISSLKESLMESQNTLRRLDKEHERTVKDLETTISSLKEEAEIKGRQYAKKLGNANKLVESYKNTTNEAVNRYIQFRATTLGVTANEVKNRLGANFTLDDVDKVCESLRSYKKNLSKLPFNITENLGNAKMAIKEDNTTKRFSNPDDVVDESLMNLI